LVWAAVQENSGSVLGVAALALSVFGWLATLIGYGIKVGKQTERIDHLSKEVDLLRRAVEMVAGHQGKIESLANEIGRLREWKHTRGNVDHQIGTAVELLEGYKSDMDKLEARILELERRRTR